MKDSLLIVPLALVDYVGTFYKDNIMGHLLRECITD
jgi:hypothetical protein